MFLRTHTPARRVFVGAVCGALAAGAGIGRGAADVGSERRPVAVYTPGPTLELGLDGAWRFGAEVALAQYVGGWGYGAAFGASTNGRMYGELQPALVLGGKTHNLVLGLNPGLVIDVNGQEPRYGAQGTFWLNYALARRRKLPLGSPLVPFVRAQAVSGAGFTVTFGIALKLPIPAS
ncbi:MAG: hypothetical protein KA712_11920 [Myxococcales bacterium]|nr:hypothetical protein [Myxococcales bacterium]